MNTDYLRDNPEFDPSCIDISENFVVSGVDIDSLQANPAWRRFLQLVRGDEIETLAILKSPVNPAHLLRVAQGKHEVIDFIWDFIGTVRNEVRADAILETETEDEMED